MSADHSKKSACIVYVEATGHMRARARARLEANGYVVREVLAEVADAVAAQAGVVVPELKACMDSADLCIFLLPGDQADDKGLGEAGTRADGLGKRIIGIVDGARDEVPQTFQDNASSLLRHNSVRLDEAIGGTEIWETPDGKVAPDRRIHHVKCQ